MDLEERQARVDFSAGHCAEAGSFMLHLHDACKSRILPKAAVRSEHVTIPNCDVLQRAGPCRAAFGQESALDEWPSMLRWADRLHPSYRDRVHRS